MTRFVLMLLISSTLAGGCALAPRAPTAPMELAGVVSGTTVIEGEAILLADVLIPAGSVLVIRPGTTIQVRPATATKIDPEYLSPATELLVRGTLRIEGTMADPVRFVLLEAPGGLETTWAGLELVGAVDSLVAGAEIEGAETGILCISSSPELRDNLLSGCRYGIIAQAGSAPAILDNRIEAGEGGIFCWLGSDPEIRGNRILGLAEEGIFVDSSSRPRLGPNDIRGNAIGLVAPAGFPVPPVGIAGNREDLRVLERIPEEGR